MWVKVIGHRAVPYVGQPGTVRNIDRASARALVLLGKVVPVDPPQSVAAPKAETSKAQKSKAPQKTTQKVFTAKTGSYKRRDAAPAKAAVMQAEKPKSDADE